jgi:hypothetical protein
MPNSWNAPAAERPKCLCGEVGSVEKVGNAEKVGQWTRAVVQAIYPSFLTIR